MKNLTLLITIFTLSFFNSWSENPKGTKLRLDLPKGKVIELVTRNETNYFSDKQFSEKMGSTTVLLYSNYKVLDKTDDGIHTLQYEITRARLDQEFGVQALSYDSDSTDNSDPTSAMIGQQLGPIINKPVTFKVNSLGKVVEKPDSAAAESMLSLSDLTEQLFLQFPEEEIKTGYSWSSDKELNTGEEEVAMQVNYTITDISKDQVTMSLDFDSESLKNEALGEDAEIRQKGSAVFNKDSGQLINLRLNQSISAKDESGAEIFMINQIETTTK